MSFPLQVAILLSQPGEDFHGRRIRDDRTAAPDPIARQRGAADGRRCRGLCGPSPPGQGKPGNLYRSTTVTASARWARACVTPPGSFSTTPRELLARRLSPGLEEADCFGLPKMKFLSCAAALCLVATPAFANAHLVKSSPANGARIKLAASYRADVQRSAGARFFRRAPDGQGRPQS